MDARTIKSKIESLERMTTANGCTPSEAQNAAAMAQRLRAKLPPEAPPQQGGINRNHGMGEFWGGQQQGPYDATLWELFRQATHAWHEGLQSTAPAWDHIREQSVLDDLDAFLGNEGWSGKLRF